ncbi:MAG: hypothetical protein KDA69_01170 [Planctomycetaceae bacterium]|nr:hypothetical protein [Planctomycetaceae bacterium]
MNSRVLNSSIVCVAVLLLAVMVRPLMAETRTWDGKHPTGNIEVTCVYFVPHDRRPLVDWQDRVRYYTRRLEQFHTREFGKQSTLKSIVHPEPVTSLRSTSELRKGDADAIYFRTLGEVDERLKFAQEKSEAFPILLVFSDINWRPLDDFFRLHWGEGKLQFEGNYNGGQHFPGAASGGARAAYLSDRGKGWGLVSGDGWRVPYRGSDCVIYHEGCGHTVGLPHPEPGNGSVMSQGQYRGWLSESWLDKEQKVRLGWEPEEVVESNLQTRLFSEFRALPQPLVPKPNEVVELKLDWPEQAEVKSVRTRFQTSLEGPWIEVASPTGNRPESVRLGSFDRATPVSYRIDAELASGETVELWGYFQVRVEPNKLPQPLALSPDLIPASGGEVDEEIEALPEREVDLLAMTNPNTCWKTGEWTREDTVLLSPKAFGARIEIPYALPEEYRLMAVVEPLDVPNGLLLGQRMGEHRFVTLFNYRPGAKGLSALENVNGLNVGNSTTLAGDVFQQGKISQVIIEVRNGQVRVRVDGRLIINWRGDAESLSLSDYWKTPNERAMFMGAYDCRYRIHRMVLQPLKGEGRELEVSKP